MGRSQETTRLLSLLRRGRATRVDDSGGIQTLQVEDHGTPIPDVPHVMPYGLACGLPRKAEGFLSMVGAAWDHVVAWGFNVANHRPTDLAEGDVTLYSAHAARLDLTDSGASVKGPKLDVQHYIDAADGYRKGGSAGLSGVFEFKDTQDGATVGLYRLTFKGGILTAAVSFPPGAWTPEV